MKVFALISVLVISFLFNNAICQIYEASYDCEHYSIYRQGEVGGFESKHEYVYEMYLSNYLKPADKDQKEHKDLIAIGNEYKSSGSSIFGNSYPYTCIFFYEVDRPDIDVEFTGGMGVDNARKETFDVRKKREDKSYKLKKGVTFLKSAKRLVCFKAVTGPVDLYSKSFKTIGDFYRYTPLFEPKANLMQWVMFHGQPIICEDREECRTYINAEITKWRAKAETKM